MPHNPNGKIDRPRLQDAIFRKKVLIPLEKNYWKF